MQLPTIDVSKTGYLITAMSYYQCQHDNSPSKRSKQIVPFSTLNFLCSMHIIAKLAPLNLIVEWLNFLNDVTNRKCSMSTKASSLSIIRTSYQTSLFLDFFSRPILIKTQRNDTIKWSLYEPISLNYQHWLLWAHEKELGERLLIIMIKSLHNFVCYRNIWIYTVHWLNSMQRIHSFYIKTL